MIDNRSKHDKPTPSFASGDIADILIQAEEIQRRVAEMGMAISRDYAGKAPLLVGVLKGSIVFMADLLRAITIPLNVDFIAISSYGPTTRSTGVVRILKDLDGSIEGRHVLLVEGIVDTGLTLGYILRLLRRRHPTSLEVATLLNKPARRLLDIPLKYVGFQIPDRFVVGYGLDYNQRYRHLPFIATLRDEVYEHPKSNPR